jgi:hypothetical protein
MIVPRIAGIRSESGNVGAVNPSQSCTISDQTSTGIVSRTLSQKRSRNIATLCPACWSCEPCAPPSSGEGWLGS